MKAQCTEIDRGFKPPPCVAEERQAVEEELDRRIQALDYTAEL